MLRGLTAFMVGHPTDHRMPLLLRSTATALTIGCLPGIALDSTATFVTLCLAVASALFGASIFSPNSRTTPENKVQVRERLISRYCDTLYRECQPLWRIDRWTESVEVNRNGDVIASILVHAAVLRNDLPFFRIHIGPNWNQPHDSRRKVRTNLTRIRFDDARTEPCEQTFSWLPDGRLEIIAHFPVTPPAKGDEIVFRFEVVWPQKAAPLMRFRQADEFVMTMGNPLAYLCYRVTLPAGTDVHATPVDLQEGVDRYRLTTSAASHRPMVELIAHDIAADRRFGMRLALG